MCKQGLLLSLPYLCQWSLAAPTLSLAPPGGRPTLKEGEGGGGGGVIVGRVTITVQKSKTYRATDSLTKKKKLANSPAHGLLQARVSDKTRHVKRLIN